MANRFWLPRDGTVLVVVDVQERLKPAMPPGVFAEVVGNIGTLMAAADILGIPLVLTEQYPAGLGRTVPELTGSRREIAVEKTTFSCCGEKSFLTALEERQARQILLVGMEAHVCVFQTLLDLLRRGFAVHLVRDAVCSRRKVDYQTAVTNAARAGATVTTMESALFQMLGDSAAPEFKAVSALVKKR